MVRELSSDKTKDGSLEKYMSELNELRRDMIMKDARLAKRVSPTEAWDDFVRIMGSKVPHK